MTLVACGSANWLIDMEAYRKNIEWASVQADRVKKLMVELGGASQARARIREVFGVRRLSADEAEPACMFLDILCQSLETPCVPGTCGSGGQMEAAVEAADLILGICDSFRFSRSVGCQV